MRTSSGFPEGSLRIKMFPGCGSQCTQPHRNICAENRSTIVVITSFKDSPSPPLPSFPFHQSLSGFSLSSLVVLWRVSRTASLLGGSRDAPLQPGLPCLRGPFQGLVRLSLSHNRTPSIHSAVMTRFEQRSLYTFGMYTRPLRRDSLATNFAIRSALSASFSKSVSNSSRSVMYGTKV